MAVYTKVTEYLTFQGCQAMRASRRRGMAVPSYLWIDASRNPWIPQSSGLLTGFHFADNPVDLFEELDPLTPEVFIVEGCIGLGQHSLHNQIAGCHARGNDDTSHFSRF
jgi:hypothetical protein